MPANKFTITISAVDKATAVANRVNQSIAKITSPAHQVGQALGRFSKATGLEKVEKDLLNIGNVARDAAGRISSMVPPLAAVASVAGAVAAIKFTRNWAFDGAQLQRDANVLGVTTTRLQALQGAAGFFGVEARELTGTLKTLGDTTEDALFGRNQAAMMMMNRLGITIHRTKSGAIDLNDELEQIADAVQRQTKPEAQRMITRMFGVENLLPLLQKGRKAIEEYQQIAKKSGAIASPALIAAQYSFSKSIIFSDLAVKGLTNAIQGKLIPVLQPLLNGFSALVVKNRAVIATNITDFIRGVADVAIIAARAVNSVVNIFGGWKVAGIALASILAGRLALSTILLAANVAKDVWIIGKAIAVTAIWAIESLPALAASVGVAAEAVGMEGLGAAFLALGAAIEATPVGWIITGLVAIGAAAYGAYKLIKQLREEHEKLNDKKPHKALKESNARRFKIASIVSEIPIIGQFALPFAAQFSANVGKLSKAQRAAELRAVKFFESKGWSPAQAVGIVASLNRESGMDSQAVGDNGNAIGLAQWHPERAAAFQRRMGKPLAAASEEEQLAFVNYELTEGSEKRAGNALRQANNAPTAAAVISEDYERPADRTGEAKIRAADAARLYALVRNTAPGSLSGASRENPIIASGSAPVAGVPAPSSAAAPTGGNSKVVVEFKNAPPGMRATIAKPGTNPPTVTVAHALASVTL